MNPELLSPCNNLNKCNDCKVLKRAISNLKAFEKMFMHWGSRLENEIEGKRRILMQELMDHLQKHLEQFKELEK